jgi:hypothetical protein
MRFFFDCASREEVVFDYVGHDFPNSRSAIEFAHEKLMLLKNCLTRDWAGWSIEVSDACGAKLCSLPIDAPAMMIVEDRFADVFMFPCRQEFD